VSNAAKMLARMRQNPRDWRIENLKTVAQSLGLEVREGKGSHVVFRTPIGAQLTVPAHKPVKPVYVRLFLQLIDGSHGSRKN
jgi:predicted RNA binding protein YcfA (HicA-like mRNA interferase family)